MRVLISGDRNYSRKNIIHTILDGLWESARWITVIAGEADGADTIAKEWALIAQDNKMGEYLGFPADWKQYNKAAGPIRNKQMLDEGKPDIVFLFHDDLENSKGTKNMRDQAVSYGIPTYLIARQ